MAFLWANINRWWCFSPLPVEVAKAFHPRLVIAVDVSAPPPAVLPQGNLSILYQSAWITYNALAKYQRTLVDIVIQPDTGEVSIFSDNQNQQLIDLGAVDNWCCILPTRLRAAA